MPKEFTSTTFSDVYKDDFVDSAGFHRVLFNSGRPLQARELTQLQTILQTQIQRFGDNVFLDGAAVGAGASGVSKAAYVQVGGATVSQYKGAVLQGPATDSTSGLQFYVVHTEDGNGEDPSTLYGFYRSYNQTTVNQDVQETQLTFAEDDTLQDIRVLSGADGLAELTVRTQPGSSTGSSTGYGLLFAIKSANFWTQGHFVYAKQQVITVSKYSQTADVDVGFEVLEDIVTVEDDESLYDNQGAVPNLSSPGADRYRIRLELTTRSSVADPSRFLFFASIRDGEVTQVSGGSSSYNEIERRMALRHHDTHGNFEANMFDIRYLPGDSNSVLDLLVPGTNKSGGNPVAFVDGFRLDHYNDETFVIDKPVSYTSEEGQATPIAYKNYVNVAYDSAGDTTMGKWNALEINLNTQSQILLKNGSVTIGTARVKHIVNTLDVAEGYRIHLYDIKMNDGQNARNVTGFASNISPTNIVKVKLTAGELYVTDPEVNTTLHNVPGGRVKSVHNLNFTVQRQFTATSNSSSQLQITTGNNEAFDDLSRWVFIDNTTNKEERVVPSNISLNSSTPQTATVTVASASKSYSVYAYVEKNSPNPRTKTYSRHGTTNPIYSNVVTDSGGTRFQFPIYDGISLVEARADSAGGRIVSDLVSFDGGQRDNYYGPVVLKPEGLPSNVSTIYARFEYFSWGVTGDYLSVNSYVLNDSFDYADIPTFTSPRDGQAYNLRNHIDFRPMLDPYVTGTNSTNRFETPRDGDNVSYDVDWYNRRVDNISLGYNPNDFTSEIRINKGVEELNPSAPLEKENEMVLYKVGYGGNTLDTKDLSIEKVKHKRYKMTDIASLENRLGTLEETVSLSFLEQEAANLVELNSSGDVRSKTGFFVDDFKGGFNLTASMVSPYWQEDDAITTETLHYLDFETKSMAVGPKSTTETVQMLLDSDNKFTGRSNVSKQDVIRKGDLMYIDYKEVLDSSLTNEVISWYSDGRSSEEQGWYNVNPYNVFTGEGFLKISPATDTWVDNHHLPDRTVYDEDITVETEDHHYGYPGKPFPDKPNTPVNPPPSSIWQVRGVEESVTVTEVVNDVTEDVLAYSVPFARQREIFGRVQGLRPNTRYWPFFDNINVEQWTIAETESEYKTHLQQNDHLRGYPEVDVTILQHPRKSVASDSTLITDYKGDLHFSFWLPNNAPVPSPNGNDVTSFEEWEEWVEGQRKEAEKYPKGVQDPQVYNDIGWKFRTGATQLLLNDVSTPVPSDGLSHARTSYVSNGTLNVSQTTIHMTRITEKKTTTTWSDPLAQSIMIDGREGVPGAFVTKIDVFMRRAPQTTTNGGTDAAIPLQLQIREMEAGVPVAYPAGEQYRVYKPADEVYARIAQVSNPEDIDDVLTHPVTFEFPEPVYLEANTEYAVVLMSECDNYEAYVSTTYGYILGKTDQRVNKQPATGSLFLSQNGSTWTPKQDQNLAYRIYTAKFKQQGSFNLVNDSFDKFNHNTERLLVDATDTTRYRVNHLGHGLGVGDKVALEGLDSDTSYFGQTGLSLMDSTAVVDSADISGYFVKTDGTFDNTGNFGAESAKTNRAFNFDHAWYLGMSRQYPETQIENDVSFITGVSHAKVNLTATADPRFDYTGRNVKMRNGTEMLFNSPKMIANRQQEFDEMEVKGKESRSIVLGTTLRSESTSTFGGASARDISTLGYVSDVSPIVDLQRSMMLMANNLIDNQPVDSASASALSNTPNAYLPETHPTMGSSPSKHITKPVVLGQAANGLRVFVDAFKPSASSFDLYYRTTSDPEENIYDKAFVLVEPENEVPDNVFNPETFNRSRIKFNEHRYLIGGEDGSLADFTKFQVKIVMKSTNTCEIPLIKSIRAIALI